MSWRLLVEDGVGAAEGLAADEASMRAYNGATPAPTLRLYTYRTHCALVGRFQDPAVELDLAACARTGTQVNRRPTGGGAIVMGEHQLGVALTTSLRDPAAPPHARAIIDTYGRGIVRGLARLGIDAEVRGKNDIAVRGRKIAGLGIYMDTADAVLFHASLLVDLDIDFMLQVLSIPTEKLGPEGIAAIRSRITTVRELTGSRIGTDEVRAHVQAGFEEEFGVSLEPSVRTPHERALIAEVLAERYDDPDWVGQRAASAPEGSSILKTPGGLVRVALRLSGNAIEHIVLSGDFMARDRAVAELEAALRWTAAERERIAAAVTEGTQRGGGLEGVEAEQLIEAVRLAAADARARRGADGTCYYPDADTNTPQEATAWR